MLEKILTLKNKQNSLNEFCENIRQGIPSAVFGVCDAFKNFLISILDEKVLYVVKDAMTARLLKRDKSMIERAMNEYLLYDINNKK